MEEGTRHGDRTHEACTELKGKAKNPERPNAAGEGNQNQTKEVEK